MNISIRPLSWTKILLLLVFALVAGVIIVGNIHSKITQKQFIDQYPSPGNLVNVGTHNLHLYCTGDGTSPVILESGAGSWSLHWHMVQSQVEKFAKVCSYDRGGFGWSEPGPTPRETDQLTEELHQLLTHSELDGPYVMVGASYGGSIIQLFEQKHPDLVSGLILVDGRPPYYSETMKSISLNYNSSFNEMVQTVRLLDDIGILSLFVSRDLIPNELPENYESIFNEVGLVTKNAASQAREAAEIVSSENQLNSVGHIGSKPLIVISHGLRNMFENRGLSKAEIEEAEDYWEESQRNMARFSENGVYVEADKSGHNIQLEQPDVIVDSIRRMLNQLSIPKQ